MTISRQQLQVINRKQLRYPLDIAEKDYYLTLAMQRIASSERIGRSLAWSERTTCARFTAL